MKIALYVEGQTEATYIRNTLVAYYSPGSIECSITALSTKRGVRVPYPIVAPIAEHHFDIYIAEGDGSVLSSMLDRCEKQLEAGYVKIVGLQDMFCERYKEHANKYDKAKIKEFKNASNEVIKERGLSNVHYTYAVMETEAWILAMPKFLNTLGAGMNVKKIKDSLGIDLNTLKPETIFHPAATLKEISELAGKTYRKKEGEVESLMSSFTKSDIDELLANGKSPSYKLFFNKILV